jgi:hypothetical protein
MLVIQKMLGFFNRCGFKRNKKVGVNSALSNNEALKPTGFKVKAQGRDQVKLECDYNSSVWIRLFQYRKVIPYMKDQDCNGSEWISECVIGSVTSKVLTGLGVDRQYFFRIVHIGHNNERKYSDEISRFAVRSDDHRKCHFDAPVDPSNKDINSMEEQCYRVSYENYKKWRMLKPS